MNVGGAIVIFVLVWWCVFFAVLPWGVRGRWESVDDGVDGADPGAPDAPDVKRKAIVATIIATPVWAVIVTLIVNGVFSFRQ